MAYIQPYYLIIPNKEVTLVDGSSGPVRLVARQDDWESENQDQKQIAIIIGENGNLSHAFDEFGAQLEMFATKGRENDNCLLDTLTNNSLYFNNQKAQKQRESACPLCI